MSARLLARLLAPIERRLKLLATRAVVRLVDPQALLQLVQVEALAGELLDGVEHWEAYGYTSHPQPGAEALLLALGGRRGHVVAVNVADRRFRLRELAPGEVALYDDQGQVIHLKRDKTIHIYGCDRLLADVATETTLTCPLVTVAASSKVVLDTPVVECSGNITAGGNITATGQIADAGGSKTMSGMRQTFDGHTHQGDSGGTTGTPNQSMG